MINSSLFWPSTSSIFTPRVKQVSEVSELFKWQDCGALKQDKKGTMEEMKARMAGGH